MRYDDERRPLSDVGATPTALQVNGSPLPSISLIRPMQSESMEEYKVCTGAEGCTGPDTGSDESCVVCRLERASDWGWLCCIHAHRSHNRFGTYYGWVRDLGAFQQEYMDVLL